MIGRILEIQENGRHLSVYRGFLVVTVEKQEIARIPLDEIAVIIINAYQLTYSHALLMELNSRGIGFIACGSNHLPAAILWPVDSHYHQMAIMKAQINASQPLCKKLWKQLIQAKILFQQEVLDKIGIKDSVFREMAARVRSGDPDNLEAQAARRYWPLLMGKDFIRNTDADGVNAMLNYGYAIIRSGVARAVMSCGLHPTFGIFHRNRLNPMCLVDDVMEPYRPYVDWEVKILIDQGEKELTPNIKKHLALILSRDCILSKNITPISIAILRTAQSLSVCFQQNKNQILQIPEILIIPSQ